MIIGKQYRIFLKILCLSSYCISCIILTSSDLNNGCLILDIYVARQPVFNRNIDLYGYELLYRSGSSNEYDGTDHSTATISLIYNSFLIMGFNRLIDGTRGFINFTHDLLENEIADILPRDKIVIEILENIKVDEQVIKACKKLKKDGYKFALDDFAFYRTDQAYTSLIELADIVKIDFQNTDKKDQIRLLNKYKNKVLFLAEKVETRVDYEEALKMGYDLFQGFFFSKPVLMKSKEIKTLNVHLLQIMDELRKEEPDFSFIAETIKKDLGLSYKLLTLANSVYFGSKFRINDIKLAVARIGIKELKQWSYIILLRSFETNENRELIKTCLLRGKLLSNISFVINQGHRETDFFLTGILSSIDVILCDDIYNILKSVAVSEAVIEALLDKKGIIWRCLNCVLLYEHLEFERFEKEIEKLGIGMNRFMELYMDALEWFKTTGYM